LQDEREENPKLYAIGEDRSTTKFKYPEELDRFVCLSVTELGEMAAKPRESIVANLESCSSKRGKPVPGE
jgi:hypothetical protein